MGIVPTLHLRFRLTIGEPAYVQPFLQVLRFRRSLSGFDTFAAVSTASFSTAFDLLDSAPFSRDGFAVVGATHVMRARHASVGAGSGL